MKRLLLTICLAVLIISAYSQQAPRYIYMTMQIFSHKDENGDRFYWIVPEENNPNVGVVTALIPYKQRLNVADKARVHSATTDSTGSEYNYFTSASGALNFLDAHGWKLFSIVPEVSGSSGSVSTGARFYLRKELE